MWTRIKSVLFNFISSALTGVYQLEEVRYVYQRVGFQCLSDTLFEDAGKHLFAGELDPRFLVRYFPDLYGNLFKPNDTLPLFAGVAEQLPPESSIEDIGESITILVTHPSSCLNSLGN